MGSALAIATASGNQGHGAITEPALHAPIRRELLKGGVGPMGHADVILVDHHGAGRGRHRGSW